MSWTREEDSALQEGILAGMSYGQMAAQIGRSRSAVAGRVMRIQLKGGNIKPPIKRKERDENAPINPNGVPLLDLPWYGCKFAIGETEWGSHLFCGAGRVEGKPYCKAHCLVAFYCGSTEDESEAA